MANNEILSLSCDIKDIKSKEYHQHAEAQLVVVSNGKMVLNDGNTGLIASETSAIWLPSNLLHSGLAGGRGVAHSLLIPKVEKVCFEKRFTQLALTPLLKSLVIRYIHYQKSGIISETFHRLKQVLLDELYTIKPIEHTLILPTDPRLYKIAAALIDQPNLSHTLKEWGHKVGASDRTLQRLFEQQTGFSFREWRTLLRLESAKEHLLQGIPISNVALQVGYESPSAFSYAFRSWYNYSPSAWLVSMSK